MSGFTPLFGAKVEYIVEEHSNVGSGHWGGASGHIFGFGSRHGDRGRHGGIGFNKSTIVENHISNGGAASIGAVLPAGIGEYREIGIWNAVGKADFVDRVGSAIGTEFKGIVRSAAKVTDEPGEGSKINNTRGDVCFSKFANRKEDIGSCVVCKIK